ncbi:MAG: hypothetical protein M3155_03690, partial [Actinomycetota bacterium]|nr:hypothetical protein [Actinomycetota bacterium]
MECPRFNATTRHAALALALALTGLAFALIAAPASAQKCTLGWDTPRWVDRSPSACEHVALSGRVAAPVASGPLGKVWFARDAGGSWQLAGSGGGQVVDGPQ